MARRKAGAPFCAEVCSEAEAEEIIAYWTPERMRNAIPVDLPTRRPRRSRREKTAEAQQGPAGIPVLYDPTPPPADRDAWGAPTEADAPSLLQVPPARPGYNYPFPFTRYEWFKDYAFPISTFGKVFFQFPSGLGGVCSGTVVISQNRSLVWTAAHCIHGGRGGDFFRNWVFVPAYRDGNAPVGVFPARILGVPTGWVTSTNVRLDIGAAVVFPNAVGTRIANVVGAQGIAFNLPRILHWHATGYPANPPFTGERLFMNAASYAADDPFPGPGPGPIPIGIGNDLGPGSSGGGWIFSFPLGWVNGVNSHGYASMPQAGYSPYFGVEAQSLYNDLGSV